MSADPSTTPTSTVQPTTGPTLVPSPSRASPMSAAYTLSFATKPVNGGTPAIDAPASSATTASAGADRPTPESRRRSRVPVWRSTMPTTRKSTDLNRAWAPSIATPASAAARVPTLTTRSRKPSWLTVP